LICITAFADRQDILVDSEIDACVLKLFWAVEIRPSYTMSGQYIEGIDDRQQIYLIIVECFGKFCYLGDILLELVVERRRRPEQVYSSTWAKFREFAEFVV